MKGTLFAAMLLLTGSLLAAQTTSPDQSGTASSPGAAPSSGGIAGSGSGSSGAPSSGTGGQTGSASAPAPVPYSPGEFPSWLRDLRRGEVIAIGSFPITLLFSSLGYQLYRYASSGFSQSTSPALFGSATSPLTHQEKVGVLLGGAGLSIIVALLDFAIGRIRQSK